MSNKHVNIKLRRGTAAEWTASNELLQLGEPGFEKDTRKLKIGDGITLWNDLPYITPDFINIVSSGSIADLTTLQQNQIVEGTIVLTTDGVRWIYSGTGSKINEASYVQLADISPAWIQITSKPASLVGLADIATTAIGDFILATGNNTYQVTNFAENVDDRVGQLVVAGSGISVNYNDSLNSLTISTSGVSFVGHTHVANDITNFNSSVSGLLPTISNSGDNRVLTSTGSSTGINAESDLLFDNGGGVSHVQFRGSFGGLISFDDALNNTIGYSFGQTQITSESGIELYLSNTSRMLIDSSGLYYNNTPISISGHTHTSSNITDFVESVQDTIGLSGFLVSGTGININYNDSLNTLTVSTTGLQPSGNYSLVGHTHTSSNITNFNSSVSGLIPVKDIISGTGISVSSLSGIYTITSTGSGVLADQAASLVTSVFNKTGSPIPKMTAVYINGGQGDQPTISLAQASGESASSKTYGLTAETINNMSAGRVIVFGALTGLNTDQFNPTAPTGDVNGVTLYLSPTTPGGLTTTKPSAPNHMVAIGTIIRTHQNEGIIEVRVQNGFELEELHNVAVSGVSNGQFLQYNSGSGLWLASSSGNFSSLTVNNTGVSLVGHTHTSSDITNFNSAVSGLLPSFLPTVVQLGSVSGTINTNAALGDIFDLTLSASGTLANPSGGADGQSLRWRITYNNNSIPLTLGSDFKIPSSASSPLPFSSTSGSMDILGATYDSSRNKWDVIAFVPGY